jgi:hypothetical protein
MTGAMPFEEIPTPVARLLLDALVPLMKRLRERTDADSRGWSVFGRRAHFFFVPGRARCGVRAESGIQADSKPTQTCKRCLSLLVGDLMRSGIVGENG